MRRTAGGSKDRSGLKTLQMLLYRRVWHHHKTTHGRVDAFPLVYQDGLLMLRHTFFLSPHPSHSPSDRLPRAPRCSPCDWWFKSVSVGRLGGKKRKTSERIHSASSSNNTAFHPLTSVWRLIQVKLETLTFIFTLTDNSLHDLVNLGSVSIHSKNVNRENGRSLLLKVLKICFKSCITVLFSHLRVWFERKESWLTKVQTSSLSRWFVSVSNEGILQSKLLHQISH